MIKDHINKAGKIVIPIQQQMFVRCDNCKRKYYWTAPEAKTFGEQEAQMDEFAMILENECWYEQDGKMLCDVCNYG